MRRDPMLLTLLILATAYFLVYYVTDPARPAGMFLGPFGFKDWAQYPLGWFGYFDQGQYLRLAHTLASFNFHQLHTTFTYGLGYPLVAVPFIWLGFDKDPFVFFDLIAFVFATYAVYTVAKRLISPFAGFLAAFGLVFATPLIHYTDQPWNSTICLVAVSVIFLMFTVKRVTKWHAMILGFFVGWVFAARYVDAIFLGALAVASIYRGSFRILRKQTIIMIAASLIFVLPVMYAQYKVFGSPFRTPYVNHIGLGGLGGSDQGFKAYNVGRVPRAGVALLVGPRIVGGTDMNRGLLIDFFWALAAIPGAFIVLKKSKNKVFFGTFITIAIVSSLFYLSFRASTVNSLQYGELHYFKMLWPGTVILAAAFFDRLMRRSLKASSSTQGRPATPHPKKQQPTPDGS